MLDKLCFVIIINAGVTGLLFIMTIVNTNNIIASVRAVGVQCNAVYSLDIPDPKIEEINQEDETP